MRRPCCFVVTLHGGFWVFRDITSSLKKKKKGWSWERVIPVSKIIAQGNDHCFGQLWILCDAGVWHTRIFECSPIEWHSASSVFRTSPSESFTKIVRKYQTQARWLFGFTHPYENEAPFGFGSLTILILSKRSDIH